MLEGKNLNRNSGDTPTNSEEKRFNFLPPHFTMDTFLVHYHTFIDRILNKPSGQHGVDPEKLEEWIQAQQSETRRELARRLAEQIVYVSFDETKDLCRQLVQQVYKDIPEGAKVVWWTGSPDKSGYFISILCYHYLLELDLPEPDSIESDVDSFDPNTIYLKWDDMTYSGSQISQLNKDIVIDCLKNPEKSNKSNKLVVRFPNIRHCLIAATTFALQRLEKVFIDSITYRKYPIVQTIPEIEIFPSSQPAWTNAKIPCPFPIYATRSFQPLDELLGPETYYLTDFFFNMNGAKCIVYFDHKIADPASTYMHVLLYGVVPPVHLDYQNINLFICDYLKPKYGECWKPKDDGLDEEGVEEIQFKPFLKGCKPHYDLFEKWKHILYSEFLAPDDHNGVAEWDEPLIRCPFSWYKTMFHGGKARTRKNRKKHRKNRRKTRSK
jgi:hypothetical protein